MTAELRLKIELVPQPLWGISLHKLFRSQWRKITATLEQTTVCAICGSTKRPLHHHEQWDYREGKTKGVATVVRINKVCSDCHMIHHIGRTERILDPQRNPMRMLEWKRLIAHFRRVNECDMATFNQHGLEARQAWDRRNRLTWTMEVAIEQIGDRTLAKPWRPSLAVQSGRELTPRDH